RRLAKNDSSQVVRRYLASACQRDIERMPGIIDALVKHAEDADDPNLPYLYWYALEPHFKSMPTLALAAASTTPISIIYPNAVRRVGAEGDADVSLILALIADQKDPDRVQVGLRAALDSLRGRRNLPQPAGWRQTYPKLLQNPDARLLATELALKF